MKTRGGAPGTATQKEDGTMTMRDDGMTRRRFLAASVAGVTAGAWRPGLAQTKTLIRQG